MPTLRELCSQFPDEWAAVERDLTAAFKRSKQQEPQVGIEKYLKSQILRTNPARRKGKDRSNSVPNESQLIRSRMIHLALKNYNLSASTGVQEGPVRFNALNSDIVQQLLFASRLERKPVSMFWFQLMWPLVWQKRLLMPLVESKGIYCFYSKQLLDALVAKLNSRPCLEIAAGDGTLTRFLSDRGAQITATDNYSWDSTIEYPEFVIRREAREALDLFAREVVICSWPPPNNNFERHVFKTRSVQTYIVIGSRNKFAAGNWKDYDRQSTFDLEEDKVLSRLVLPPELDSAVYIFRRKSV